MDKNSTDDKQLLTSSNINEGEKSTESIESTREKSAKELYFDQLAIWVKQTNLSLNAINGFPYYFMANYPKLLVNPTQIASSNQTRTEQPDRSNIVTIINRNRARGGGDNNNLFDNQLRSEEIINQNGGYEYVIAPLWKRFVAEIIDVCILFVIKLLVAFMIIDIFEIDFGFDFDAIRSTIEEDYTEFLIFSSEMIYVEIITKIFVCIYEAMWTRDGLRFVGGATPGKLLMKIRILYVEAVVPIDQPAAGGAGAPAGVIGGIGQPPLQQINNLTQAQPPLRALLYPAQNPGFKRAFSRALSKNLLMALLFPLCFVMLFFRNNRTSYDIMTKTIVVEHNPMPILRPARIT